eukprot:CCRYP_009579-RA/>CCRYP_009579-RA protein AED:0.58 eAED:0.60 QI:0/0/0/1/0/0/2/0/151
MNIQEQNTINELGEIVTKERLTHDQSYKWKSETSINSRTKDEHLLPCLLGQTLRRSLSILRVFDSANTHIDLIDCKGQVVSPGFIDIQLSGAYGVDFSNGPGLNIEDILLVARRLLANGVTSFCPTMVSSSRETYRQVIPLVRQTRKQQYD